MENNKSKSREHVVECSAQSSLEFEIGITMLGIHTNYNVSEYSCKPSVEPKHLSPPAALEQSSSRFIPKMIIGLKNALENE